MTVTWGSATFVGTIDPNHVGYFNGEIVAKIVGGGLVHGASRHVVPERQSRRARAVRRDKSSGSRRRNALRRNGHGQTSNELVSTIARFYCAQDKPRAGVLEDVLAPGVCHWTDFDGATRVGLVRLLRLLPALRCSNTTRPSKWADIDADDPANLLGAPSRPIRSAKRPRL